MGEAPKVSFFVTFESLLNLGVRGVLEGRKIAKTQLEHVVGTASRVGV